MRRGRHSIGSPSTLQRLPRRCRGGSEQKPLNSRVRPRILRCERSGQPATGADQQVTTSSAKPEVGDRGRPAKRHGPSVKNPKQYEGLRDEGMKQATSGRHQQRQQEQRQRLVAQGWQEQPQERLMASEAQRNAAKKNIKKATAAAKSKETISKLPKETRSALGSRPTR